MSYHETFAGLCQGLGAPSLFAGTVIEMGCIVLSIVTLKADFLSPWI